MYNKGYCCVWSCHNKATEYCEKHNAWFCSFHWELHNSNSNSTDTIRWNGTNPKLDIKWSNIARRM